MNEPKVIVSLTSHSIRIKQVAKTAIFSIIKNTFKDLKIVLTLYKDDVILIPEDLKLLIDNKIIELIIADKDLGPHLKYFYVMQKYRDLPIITIDDDCLYPEDMIEELYNSWLLNKECIIARRCFDIKHNGKTFIPYIKWIYKLTEIKEPTYKIFATGIGGILYPPNCLEISEENIDEILTIKYDDDFYLKALEIRKDIKILSIVNDVKKLYKKNLCDKHTQSIALWNKNVSRSEISLTKYKKEFLDAITR